MLSVREISKVSCDDAVDAINDPASFSKCSEAALHCTAGHILIEMLKYFWRNISLGWWCPRERRSRTAGWPLTRLVGMFHTRWGEVTRHSMRISNIIAIILPLLPRNTQWPIAPCEIGRVSQRRSQAEATEKLLLVGYCTGRQWVTGQAIQIFKWF